MLRRDVDLKMLFCSLLALFSLFLPMNWWLDSIAPGLQSVSWRQVPAIIVLHQSTGKLLGRGSSVPGTITVYSYRTGGVTYQNDLVRFSDVHSRVGWLIDEEKYPVGRQVMAYVNPTRPSEAVLEPGVPRESWFFFTFLSVLAAATSLSTFTAIREHSRARL